MNKHRICLLGGTGFVGSQLCQKLVKQGHSLKLLCRRPDERRHLALLPNVSLVEADIHQQDGLDKHLVGCDVVINLTGILNEQGKRSFQQVHAELPAKIAMACRRNGIRRILHMSALNAAIDAPSRYLQSKATGEEALHNFEELDVTSFRPSVIFGRYDSFFNKFATLLRNTPLVMPLPGAYARFAPVYVGDVADAFVRSIDHKQTYGQRYNLCGPKAYTLLELLNYLQQQTGRNRRLIIPLGPGLTAFMAMLMQYMPGKPLTPDNVRSMACDSVCDGPWPDVFGFTPHSIDAIVPNYLGTLRYQVKLDNERRHAARDKEV